ncbi:AAA family ATPase [Streptomyces sp. NPDC088725]|uniref:AAA family ATPase n=1 Tax=Streptomyces sp. NPDC088725 TaxID=3365873 RepID=UPI003825F629
MITRIEIDGFKSFVGFELDVRPCTVLMGVNGAGKSNLLDALDLVRRTFTGGFASAFDGENPRLAARDLFHHADGPGGAYTASELTIRVGLIVPTEWGPLPLVVRLVARLTGERAGHPVGARLDAGRSGVWVSSLEDTGWMDRLALPRDLRAGLAAARELAGRTLDRYWLSFRDRDVLVGGGGPRVSPLRLFQCVLRETATWERVSLDPAGMRRPFAGSADRPLFPDGSNLAAVLARLGTEELHDMEADLAALIPEASGIRPVLDDRRGEYDFDVRFRHTGWTPPPMLSDGTMRVLALLAAWYDTSRTGVLAVEEIENGLHPTRIAELVRRLRRDVDGFEDMADKAPTASGFRQLIATTHSPVLLSALREDSSGCLVFLEKASHIEPGRPGISTVTRARPVRERVADEEPNETVSSEQVKRLLESMGQVIS